MRNLMIILVILLVILAGCGQSADTQKAESKPDGNKGGVNQSEPQQTEKDTRKYTLEMYQKIKVGNTYDEVAAIVGDSGEAMVDNERLKQYQWTNDDQSYINVTFYDLAATAKCQAYLGPFLKGNKAVTVSMYNKLKEGMTLQEVTDILGPGIEKMLVIEGGKEKITMGWDNAYSSGITVTFLDGKAIKINSLGIK